MTNSTPRPPRRAPGRSGPSIVWLAEAPETALPLVLSRLSLRRKRLLLREYLEAANMHSAAQALCVQEQLPESAIDRALIAWTLRQQNANIYLMLKH